MVVLHLTDDDTAEALLDEVIGSKIGERWIELESKLCKLITPYRQRHPITYNYYFTETIQNMRHR